MAFASRLYAVVPNTEPATEETPRPASHRRSRAELHDAAAEERKRKKVIDRANAVLDRLQARRDRYQEAIAKLQRREALAAARIARMEERTIAELEDAGLQRADGFERHFETRATPSKVEILDQTKLPKGYLRTPPPPPPAPDKIAIRSVLSRALAEHATRAELEAAAELDGAARLTSCLTLLR